MDDAETPELDWVYLALRAREAGLSTDQIKAMAILAIDSSEGQVLVPQSLDGRRNPDPKEILDLFSAAINLPRAHPSLRVQVDGWTKLLDTETGGVFHVPYVQAVMVCVLQYEEETSEFVRSVLAKNDGPMEGNRAERRRNRSRH